MSVHGCQVCGKTMIERHCPHCGAMVDDHLPVNGVHVHPTPEQDLSICVFCSGLSIFTEDGLRVTTEEEWKAAMSSPEAQAALEALGFLRARGRIPNARDE